MKLSRKQLNEAALHEKCRRDPLYWLQHLTATYDEHWEVKGLATPYNPFPPLPYFPWLLNLFRYCPRLFLAKSRDMMASWAVVGYGTWKCQFFERIGVIVQSQKQEKSNGLIGYAKTLYERQPAWLKARHPLKKRLEDMPEDKLIWANGSIIHGVPSGADQIRFYHPTILIVDEAAYVDDFEGSFDAANPVCAQIIAVSSAAPSWFGDECQSAEWYY